MLKIGTHDSATGESGRGILSWLVTPFAKTQSKTIEEQYAAGCRNFDIRFREDGDDWVCAHGLWTSKRTLDSIISEIDAFDEPCYVSLTYEGREVMASALLVLSERLRNWYPHIIWGNMSVKYGKDAEGLHVKYDVVVPADKNFKGGVQGFLPLDGSTWHTYLPIPWLWDRLYKRPHKFNEDTFTIVDFL